VQVAIKSTKDWKAPGPDDLPADVLELIEEQYLDPVIILFNKIYETGIITRRVASVYLCRNSYEAEEMRRTLQPEEIFTTAIENEEGGIPVNGILLNNLRYADDTVLRAKNMSYRLP